MAMNNFMKLLKSRISIYKLWKSEKNSKGEKSHQRNGFAWLWKRISVQWESVKIRMNQNFPSAHFTPAIGAGLGLEWRKMEQCETCWRTPHRIVDRRRLKIESVADHRIWIGGEPAASGSVLRAKVFNLVSSGAGSWYSFTHWRRKMFVRRGVLSYDNEFWIISNPNLMMIRLFSDLTIW